MSDVGGFSGGNRGRIREAEALTVQLPAHGRSSVGYKPSLEGGLSVMPASRTYNVTVEKQGRRPLKRHAGLKRHRRQQAENAASHHTLASSWSGYSDGGGSPSNAILDADSAILDKHLSKRPFEVGRRFPALTCPRQVPAWATEKVVREDTPTAFSRTTQACMRKQQNQDGKLQDTSRSTCGMTSGSSTFHRALWQPGGSSDAVELICDRKPALFDDAFESVRRAERVDEMDQKARWVGQKTILPTSRAYECDTERQELQGYVGALRERGRGIINANLRKRYDHKRTLFKAQRAERGGTSNFEISVREKVKAEEQVRVKTALQKEQAAAPVENVFGHMASTFKNFRLG